MIYVYRNQCDNSWTWSVRCHQVTIVTRALDCKRSTYRYMYVVHALCMLCASFAIKYETLLYWEKQTTIIMQYHECNNNWFLQLIFPEKNPLAKLSCRVNWRWDRADTRRPRGYTSTWSLLFLCVRDIKASNQFKGEGGGHIIESMNYESVRLIQKICTLRMKIRLVGKNPTTTTKIFSNW